MDDEQKEKEPEFDKMKLTKQRNVGEGLVARFGWVQDLEGIFGHEVWQIEEYARNFV
jgi:hypothetical protein